MRVEVDFYDIRVNGDDPVESLSVNPGGIEASNFFGKNSGLLTSCNSLDGSSTVTVTGDDALKRIAAKVYQDEEDFVGEQVELVNGRITFVEPQELILFFYQGKECIKEAAIYIWSEEDGFMEDLVPSDSDRLVAV